jgi:hypothetical protein
MTKSASKAAAVAVSNRTGDTSRGNAGTLVLAWLGADAEAVRPLRAAAGNPVRTNEGIANRGNGRVNYFTYAAVFACLR